MEHSPWEANGSSDSQQILRIFCNSKIYWRVQKSLPLVPIARQFSPVHSLHFMVREYPFEFCTGGPPYPLLAAIRKKNRKN